MYIEPHSKGEFLFLTAFSNAAGFVHSIFQRFFNISLFNLFPHPALTPVDAGCITFHHAETA